MKILGLDSSANSVSCAICEDGTILCETTLNISKTHSKTIFNIIKSLLDFLSIEVKDIDLFAVSSGPGSFTGIRIAISAIKGMAIPFNTPCISISTLEGLAYNLSIGDKIIASVLDARNNNLFAALFEYKDNKLIRLCEDKATSIPLLDQELSKLYKEKKVWLVGDGANLCYNCFKDKGYFITTPHNNFLRGSSVAILAYLKYKNVGAIKAENLIPNYIKLSQAERELLNKGD